MGFLRIWFAFLVLVSHTNMMPLAGALAVECFFGISGFYIQMMIQDNYSLQPHWMRKFYASRLLRIFIPYWIILAIILLISFFAPASLKVVTIYDLGSPHAVLMNLLIAGSEQMKLLCSFGEMFFREKMVIAQAWSLGMELLFYIAAPFMLTRAWLTIFVMLASIGLKYMFLSQNAEALTNFPWWDGLLSGIVIHEIGIFAFGALCYRFYRRYLRGNARFLAWCNHPAAYYAAVGFMVSGTLSLPFIFAAPSPAEMMIGYYSFVACTILFLPLLFSISRNHPADRRIGEVSYAFYLCHSYILNWVELLGLSRGPTILIALAGTLCCATAITYFIEKPLTAIRHRLFWAKAA